MGSQNVGEKIMGRRKRGMGDERVGRKKLEKRQ